MTSQNRDKTKLGRREELPSRRLLDSPSRLIILCIAVLVISASGGVLLGNLLSKQDETTLVSSASAMAMQESPVVAISSPYEESEDLIDSPFTYNDFPQDETVEMQTTALDIRSSALILTHPPLVPKKTATDMQDPPWKKYAALAPPLKDKPLIAIVIDDVGLSRKRVDELVKLPALLTLAFLPYAPGLQGKADMARNRGHEVMLHMPMEPTDHHVDPGPDALLLGLSDEELRRRTRKNLDSFTGYVGVNNHMGSRFTANNDAMAIVLDMMAERGLLFLDSKTTAASVGYRLAVQRGMPSAKRDIFIDNVITEEAILKQLDKIEKVADRKGVAIAIGHPHLETISALKKWLPDARARGFLFIPISAVTALTFKG
ncbi:MAG: hypothetical protein COB93_07505 [Sneathiella sp.]|nr:MAG: hypothetical protein COB93_07505 [Sneathiella sp.]